MFSRWHPAWKYLGGSALILVALVALLIGPGLLAGRSGVKPIVVHCAAGLRAPMTEIAAEYERATGQSVELRFDGSETLLNSMILVPDGDIYLPADDSYITLARDHGLDIANVTSIARQKAVLVVPSRNPKSIGTWNDLMQKKATLAQARPESAAIGKLTRERLTKVGTWKQLERMTVAFLPNVGDVVNAVALETVDAGIVWDALAVKNARLSVIAVSELDGIEANVQAGLLPFSANREAAQAFIEYLATTGRRILREHGFRASEEP